MKKIRKLPHEGAARTDADDVAQSDSDTEGHRAGAMPRTPGTGGDDAVPRMPGTGGDAFPRRPSSGGELTDEDDVEGHRLY